jgi:hypothetical protein
VSLVGELLLLRSRGSVQTLYLPLQLGATLTTLKLSDADPCGGGPSDRVRRLVMFDGCFGDDAPANAAIRLATLQPRDVLVTAGSSVRQQQRPSADGTEIMAAQRGSRQRRCRTPDKAFRANGPAERTVGVADPISG